MLCDSCGNKEAYAFRIKFSAKGQKSSSCNRCGGRFLGVPDVYFQGEYTDEHLATEEHPGPKIIRSRQDKKYWLDKCHLRESGDRVHGATAFDKISHRYAMESLKK